MSSISASSGFPLAMASEDSAVRIIALQGGSTLSKRLTEMGLNVGSEIVVRQRQGASGLVISRGETRFALGFGMASKIMVCPV